VRVRVADGKALSTGGHLPGAEVWLVCERRSNERKFYVTNHRAETPLAELVAAIKGRWVCEQGHQQMKEELGLDHCECRNWLALHHHTLLTMIALCFLQHLRLREKKWTRARPKPDRHPFRRCPRSVNVWFKCSSPSHDRVHTVSAQSTTA
jgi:SRSO17 transposase